jgi:nucleoid-associated protein YgaU
MSVRRLALTVVAMALIGVALRALTPDVTAMAGALAHAQRTSDTAGADTLVIAASGLLAWAVWAWGALGLALTALTALPGGAGTASALLVRRLLPAGARRSAALALGLGLGVAAPLLGTASLLLPTPAAAAEGAAPSGDVPDWPAAVTAPAPATSAVPDWPATPPPAGPPTTTAHVVVPGDCLWDIAGTWLRGQSGGPPTNGAVVRGVDAWWRTNAAAIGPDPDRLLPGQLLTPPEAP